MLFSLLPFFKTVQKYFAYNFFNTVIIGPKNCSNEGIRPQFHKPSSSNKGICPKIALAKYLVNSKFG